VKTPGSFAGSAEGLGSGEVDGFQVQASPLVVAPVGIGTWQYAPQGNRETDLYPHLTLLGNGKVLLAGPGPDDSGVLDPATMTWTSAPGHGPRRMYGTELLDPNGTGPSLKVTEIGGFADKTPPGQTTYPPTNTSQTLDLGANPLQWTAAPSLNVARANHNTLWLPDGTMLTVGGGNGRFNGSTYELQPGKPEHQVELFNPASGQWVLGPAQQIDRAYHSTALLLPDGRVLSAGDDNAYVTGQPYEGSAHNSAEIYSPPYLFRGPRPSITSAPNGSLYNTPFRVSLANVDPRQAHAVLIPPGAITHSTNPNPRIVPLSSTPTASGLQLLAPANENIAPRGWYMLFVVNANGVPSVATWLRVGYPGSGGPPGTAQRPRVTRAVEWIRVARRQSFRKGYLVAYLGLALNKSTVRGSVLLPSGRGRRTTRTRLVATRVVHGAHAGTFKLVVRLRRSAVGRRRLRGRHKVVLRVQVSASGAPAYRGERTIVDTRR
jgi:hypothetical protein